MSARWVGVDEPRSRPAPRHAKPAPLPWRDRLTLGLGLPLLSLGALGATTQARAEQPPAVTPDLPPADTLPDRPDPHPDRHGTRPPFPTP
ncbi:hypothetical protein ACIBG6_38615 [Streptomyces sp. NPDC050842]|uniref:hypothetical protein n=1 Tax=Streptomyces sp. NPDC050842 TaxID=3365636 RepID=UPI0037B2268C